MKSCDDGLFFAWGETSCKDEYTKKNSKTYKRRPYYREIGGDPSLDAARAMWGGSWRLPTVEEFIELKKHCTWEWSSLSMRKGYLVTGPNGNSIFLPAAGCQEDKEHEGVNYHGFYWSSTPNRHIIDSACALTFDNSLYYVDKNIDRYIGLSVRPVTE